MELITYAPHFGEPSGSPFCVKAMCLLQMSGVTWAPKFTGDPRKAPNQKLPVLVDGDTVVADSAEIAAYLQNKTGHDFDKGLNEAQKAQSHALLRLCEEHLYFLLMHERWTNPNNWQQLRQAFFGDIPWGLRSLISSSVRKSTQSALHGQGTGRQSNAARLARAQADINTIKVMLGEQPYLFGERPTLADTSIAPMLAALAGTPVQTDITRLVSGDQKLNDYCARVRGEIYPKT
ncbi:MAG: glutathione S-transferase family protein [Planktomarina sp.]